MNDSDKACPLMCWVGYDRAAFMKFLLLNKYIYEM